MRREEENGMMDPKVGDRLSMRRSHGLVILSGTPISGLGSHVRLGKIWWGVIRGKNPGEIKPCVYRGRS